MPEITPLMPEGTISITAKTQMPSAKPENQQVIQALSTPKASPESPSTGEVTSEQQDTLNLDQKKLRALLHREKQLVNYKKKLDSDQRELDLQKAQSRQWMEAAELAKQNKLEALAKLGITYDDLTQQILAGGQVPPAQIAEVKAQEIARREIDAFKAEQRKQAEDTQKSQYEQGLTHVTNEIKFAVEKNADKYPLVKLDESYHDIAKWIESEFHRTGRITPVEDALERWENDALTGLEELIKIDKVRNKFTSQDRPQPTAPQRPSAQPAQTTLNHKATAPIPAPKSMTDSERRQRAIDAFYGRLT